MTTQSALDLTLTHRIMSQSEPRNLDALRTAIAALAKDIAPGDTIGFIGPLGAGKTTAIQALVAALGYTGHAKSPSFVLQHIYETQGFAIEHWDLYRLLDAPPDQLASLRREIGTTGNLVLIEWPEPLLALGWGQDATLWSLAIADDSHRILTRWTRIAASGSVRR